MRKNITTQQTKPLQIANDATTPHAAASAASAAAAILLQPPPVPKKYGEFQLPSRSATYNASSCIPFFSARRGGCGYVHEVLRLLVPVELLGSGLVDGVQRLENLRNL